MRLEDMKLNSALIRLEEATEDLEAVRAELKASNVVNTDLLFGVKQRLTGALSIIRELEDLA